MCGHVAQWAGAFGEGVALCERATEEPLHHRVGCAGDDGGVGQRLRIPGEQIRGRILRAAGRDGGGEMAVGIVGGSGEFIRRSCEQGDEVAAGGGTPRPDARRIEAVVAGMRAEPADGALAILDLGGENRVARARPPLPLSPRYQPPECSQTMTGSGAGPRTAGR